MRAGRSPAATAQSAAMMKPSKNSNPAVAVIGNGASSSVRRSALASAARTSPASQLNRGELVERGALDQRVADAAGQRERPLDEVHGGRVGHVAVERLGGQQPGLRRQVVAGQRPPLARCSAATSPDGRLGGHDARDRG